jgi:hypothetical protein
VSLESLTLSYNGEHLEGRSGLRPSSTVCLILRGRIRSMLRKLGM